MLDFLKELITKSPSGLINYADYIRFALYHPDFGYYMKDKLKIGPMGDFITTSNVSDIFGRTFAKWLSKIINQNQITPTFCEIGAGNGRFAKAFLAEWNETNHTPINYVIVESSPYHRRLQAELLIPDFSIKQVETLDDLANFEGIIFSNELFDALPVHVVEKENGQIFEIMIGLNKNEFFEKKIPLANKEILNFLSENEIDLHEKQRMEIPLEMGSMLSNISKILSKGMAITVDYGYSNEEWMEPSRRKGSLRGYYQHQMIEDVLQHPGEMDITSHIHFDWLRKRGEQLNLEYITKLRQDEFLLKTGILEELENHYDPNPFSEVSKRNRAIRSLIMPSSMSSFFHVMIQEKGLELRVEDLFEL